MNLNTEPNDHKLNYIRLQCRRGMLELDEILLKFLNNHYIYLPETEQQQFSYLLQQNDADLFDWLFDKVAPKEIQLKNIIYIIQNKLKIS